MNLPWGPEVGVPYSGPHSRPDSGPYSRPEPGLGLGSRFMAKKNPAKI